MRLKTRFWCFLMLPFVVNGACGGSTGDDTPVDPEALMQNACDTITGLNCPGAITAEECDTELHKERATAVAEGCDSQFDAFLVCLSQKLSSCGVEPPDICGPEIDAFNVCEMGDAGDTGLCSMGTGGMPQGAPPYYQKCSVLCPSWGADCETTTSPTLECTCSPSGATFALSGCSELSMAVAQGQCG